MFIKICGTTSEEDALFAVSMGADAVGFIFAPSKRQVSVEVVSEIIKRLPPEVMTVGVFKDESKEIVARVVNSIGLGGAQLHGHESPEDTIWIAERVNFVIKAFPAGHSEVKNFSHYGADVLLLDAPEPGSGKVFDWSLAEDVQDPSRLLLSGGLTPENVAGGIMEVKPWGVDVTTGVEATPGKKDPLKIREFILTARKADAETFRNEPPSGDLYDWQRDARGI